MKNWAFDAYMIRRIVAHCKKREEIFLYLLFGFLTTLVNYLVYLPLLNAGTVAAALASVVAWCVAVIFAFVTNKNFVFKSKNWSCAIVVPEFFSFSAARVISLIVESVIIYITVDLLAYNGVYMKIATSIIVVILNYIASKMMVFNKKRGG